MAINTITSNSDLLNNSSIAASNFYTTTSTSALYFDQTTLTATPIQTGNYYTSYISGLDAEVEKAVEEYFKKEKKMDKNFNFGCYNSNNIKLSAYGIAIKNKSNKWVSYNTKEKKLIDVEVFNFDIDVSKVFYRLPKATHDVKTGDIILHNDKPVFVERVRADGKFDVIDPYEGVAVTILPLSSPFGFDFTECLFCIIDCFPSADEDNPFGNLLPLLLTNNGDNNALLMAMLMDNTEKFDPMLLLLCNGKDNNLGMFLLMHMMKHKKKKEKASNKQEEDDDGDCYIALV